MNMIDSANIVVSNADIYSADGSATSESFNLSFQNYNEVNC